MKIRLIGNYLARDLTKRLWDCEEITMSPFKVNNRAVTIRGILDPNELHAFAILGENLGENDSNCSKIEMTIVNRPAEVGWKGMENAIPKDLSDKHEKLRNLGLGGFYGFGYNRLLTPEILEIGTIPSHCTRPQIGILKSLETEIMGAYRTQFPNVTSLVVPYNHEWLGLVNHYDEKGDDDYLDLSKHPGKEDPEFFRALELCKVNTSPLGKR